MSDRWNWVRKRSYLIDNRPILITSADEVTGDAVAPQLGAFYWTQINHDDEHQSEAENGDNVGPKTGYSVALNNNGKYAIFGEPTYSYNGTRSGAVQVYKLKTKGAASENDHIMQRMGTGQIGTFKNEDFGYSVAISDNGQRIAIGAPHRGLITSNVDLAVVDYTKRGLSLIHI